MKQNLRSVQFYKDLQDVVESQKRRLLPIFLEELSRPVPDVRFYQAEFRRLAQFESNLFKILENYPGAVPDFYNKTAIALLVRAASGTGEF